MLAEIYLYIFPLKSYMHDYLPTAVVYFIKVKRTGGLYLWQAGINMSHGNMTKDSLVYGAYPLCNTYSNI